MTTELEQFSSLVGDIYDASLDPALWPDILGKTCGFVGGDVAGLLSKDSVSKIGNAHYHFGADPYYLQLYEQTYWRFDPLAPLLFFPTEEVMTVRDYMTDEELRSGRFCREWLEPQGWLDAANVVLDKSATSCAILSVVRKRSSGLVDEDMLRKMRLLVPHVRRAILVGKTIELKTADAAMLADALDRLSAGMFLVNAHGYIVHANARANTMLAERSPLRSVAGKIAASDVKVERALHDLFVAAARGDAAVGAKGIALPLTAEDRTDYVAHILPLTSGSRRRVGMAYSAAAAMFVHKAEPQMPSPPEVIARTFKLTPSELGVLMAIVEIGGVPETAEALGISEGTVKTHLKRVFAKTGTSSQRELVKLMVGFSGSPSG